MKKFILLFIIILILAGLYDGCFTNHIIGYHSNVFFPKNVTVTGLQISGAELTEISRESKFDSIITDIIFVNTTGTMYVYGYKNGTKTDITDKFIEDISYTLKDFNYGHLNGKCQTADYTGIAICHFKPIKKFRFLSLAYFLYIDVIGNNLVKNTLNPVPPGPPGKL